MPTRQHLFPSCLWLSLNVCWWSKQGWLQHGGIQMCVRMQQASYRVSKQVSQSQGQGGSCCVVLCVCVCHLTLKEGSKTLIYSLLVWETAPWHVCSWACVCVCVCGWLADWYMSVQTCCKNDTELRPQQFHWAVTPDNKLKTSNTADSVFPHYHSPLLCYLPSQNKVSLLSHFLSLCWSNSLP